MSHEQDQAYFARRCDEENCLGDAAATPEIASVHYELAYRYALLCGDRVLNSSLVFLNRRAAG